jgi:hypothetical protein
VISGTKAAKNIGKSPSVHRKLTNFGNIPIAKYTNLVYNIIWKINKP